MSEQLLKIDHLHACIEDKELMKGLNLSVDTGKVHVIMGPNGAGKSTLANVIMGHPKYQITNGSIVFKGEDITDTKPDYRAKKGLFLSFQSPEEIAGITVENFLRAAKAAVTGEEMKPLAFHKELLANMKKLDQDPSYASRYLNVGFSGGEKKKNEILQLLVLNPRLAILDETDSGLDVDAVHTVSEGINQFRNESNAIIIITHNIRMLEQIQPDVVHVLIDGRIVHTGDASLAFDIAQNGFADFEALNA